MPHAGRLSADEPAGAQVCAICALQMTDNSAANGGHGRAWRLAAPCADGEGGEDEGGGVWYRGDVRFEPALRAASFRATFEGRQPVLFVPHAGTTPPQPRRRPPIPTRAPCAHTRPRVQTRKCGIAPPLVPRMRAAR